MDLSSTISSSSSLIPEPKQTEEVIQIKPAEELFSDADQWSGALFNAVRADNPDRVNELLEQEPEDYNAINKQNDFGETVLHHAVTSPNNGLDISNALVKTGGIDMAKLDKNGDSALEVAQRLAESTQMESYRDTAHFLKYEMEAELKREKYYGNHGRVKELMDAGAQDVLGDKLNDYIDKHNRESDDSTSYELAGSDFKGASFTNASSIEKVDGLGQHAVLVKYREKDGHQRNALVARTEVGDEMMDRMLRYSQHKDMLNDMEALGARRWTKSKFKTTLNELDDTVGTVYTKFQDYGIIAVNFRDWDYRDPFFQNYYSGQTIIISERDTPEAFDLIRHFVATGDDKYPGSIDSGPPPETNLTSLPGEVEDWIALEQKYGLA